MSFISSFFGTRSSTPPIDPKQLNIPENATQEELNRAIGLKYGAKAGDSVSTGHMNGEYYAMINRKNGSSRPEIFKAGDLDPKFKQTMEKLHPIATERLPLRGYSTPGIYQPALAAAAPSSTAPSPSAPYNPSAPLYWNPTTQTYGLQPPPPPPAATTPSAAETLMSTKTGQVATGAAVATLAAAICLRSFFSKKSVPSVNTGSSKAGPALPEVSTKPPTSSSTPGSLGSFAEKTATASVANNPTNPTISPEVAEEIMSTVRSQSSHLFTDARNALWEADHGSALALAPKTPLAGNIPSGDPIVAPTLTPASESPLAASANPPASSSEPAVDPTLTHASEATPAASANPSASSSDPVVTPTLTHASEATPAASANPLAPSSVPSSSESNALIASPAFSSTALPDAAILDAAAISQDVLSSFDTDYSWGTISTPAHDSPWARGLDDGNLLLEFYGTKLSDQVSPSITQKLWNQVQPLLTSKSVIAGFVAVSVAYMMLTKKNHLTKLMSRIKQVRLRKPKLALPPPAIDSSSSTPSASSSSGSSLAPSASASFSSSSDEGQETAAMNLWLDETSKKTVSEQQTAWNDLTTDQQLTCREYLNENWLFGKQKKFDNFRIKFAIDYKDMKAWLFENSKKNPSEQETAWKALSSKRQLTYREFLNNIWELGRLENYDNFRTKFPIIYSEDEKRQLLDIQAIRSEMFNTSG